MKKVEQKTKKQLIMDNHKLKLQNVLLEKQKQEALLQKEQNSKLLKQLEFYEKACKHQPEQLVPTPKNECITTENKQPLLPDMCDSLINELRLQHEALYTTISKICIIDDGTGFEEKKEDKIYRNGACGYLQRITDLARENRIYIDIINERLKNLVG